MAPAKARKRRPQKAAATRARYVLRAGNPERAGGASKTASIKRQSTLGGGIVPGGSGTRLVGGRDLSRRAKMGFKLAFSSGYTGEFADKEHGGAARLQDWARRNAHKVSDER